MASKAGYMRFLRKKMADGGKVSDKGASDAQIASAAGLAIDPKTGKQGIRKPLTGSYSEGGEIGGDPGYGQEYHRHNSSGEPHTNEYFEDEHPMEYMAEGGMVSHYNEDSNHPDPDHHMTSPEAGPLPSYSNQYGEPYPSNEQDDELDPDLSHEDAMSDEMANFADGGMVYEHQGHMGEDEEDQMSPDLSDDEAMSREAPGFAHGGKLGSGKRFEHLTHQLAGKGANDPKALAAYIGRKSLGKERFQNLAEKGRARAEHHAHGGMAGKHAFARALSKRGMK